MIAFNGDGNANPHEPANNGGLGGELHPAGEYPIQSDKALARMEGRALKWNVTPRMRQSILRRQYRDAIDVSSSPRDRNRAAKFILDADRLDTTIDISNNKQTVQQQTNVHIENHVSNGVQVVYDGNWYGNEDRLPPATS